MKEAKLLGTILPSHPDLIPIVNDIRCKYDLPEIDAEDDVLRGIILSDQDIDFEAMQNEIEEKVKAIPDLITTPLSLLYQKFNALDTENLLEDEWLSAIPEPQKGELITAFIALNDYLITPIMDRIEEFYQTISVHLFEFLITGETREIPIDWLGGVITLNVLGTPLVLAMAGPSSDPKEIRQQFMTEYHRNFGKYHPNIKESHIKSAEFLRMKLSGMKIKDIADVYIQEHPSQFPEPADRKAYIQSKRKCEEMLKKRIQRIDNTLGIILGDNPD